MPLPSTFADQAVIAIENTRLFEAEQQRTRELTESLEQQTATSEVLEVISSSPGDLEPVFAAMLENAVRICDAKFGNIYRWDGELFQLLAAFNTPPAFVEAHRRSPMRPERLRRRMVDTKTAVHVADLAADEDYIENRERAHVSAVELGGVRTYLTVPMLKENDLVGSLSLYRQEVRPFTGKQIALVQNFAAQAVIAIENAQLLNELRESLQQQTATADVLRSSAGRHSICNRCSTRLLNRRRAYVKPTWQRLLAQAVISIGWLQATVIRGSSKSISPKTSFHQAEAQSPDAWCSKAGPSMFPMFRRTPNFESRRRQASAVYAPCWAFHFCVKAVRSGLWWFNAALLRHLLTNRSNLPRPSPIRR